MEEKELIKFYNQSKDYYKLAEEGREGIFPIHKEILRECKQKRGLIVDLGCGTGLDILAMAGEDNKCLGIDISHLAIKKALARAKNKKNVDFKQADLENLPLVNNSVDVITSFVTFEHLFNPETVLSEIDRALKPGGETFLLFPNFASPFRGAPVFGGIRKVRIIKKMILSLWRIFNVRILGKNDFKVKTIDKSLINKSKIGHDWDATNEPSIFEFVNYFRRKNYQVDFGSWLSPPKTKIEKFFSNFKNWPIIKYWGPTAYLYVKKR